MEFRFRPQSEMGNSNQAERPASVEYAKSRLEEAYQRSQKVLNKSRIDVEAHKDEFAQVYSVTEIERDLREVEMLKSKFGSEVGDERKLGSVFEAILHEQIELNEWLGAGATTVKTSDYDDYVGGMDDIVEFERDEASLYMGLAIDATTSSDTAKKLQRIKKEIEQGVLPGIKYYRSSRTKEARELPNVPVLIIEARPETVMQLAELWVGRKNATLGRHRIRVQIIKEMLMQANYFKKFAIQCNKSGVARVYDSLIDRLEGILATVDKKEVKDDGSIFNLEQDIQRVFGKMEASKTKAA
ncbi:MAG: hypothetical protein JWO40_492 [Candidatus Doudnabacteria bacterium]|nr:hypothetical protein [Candidatus Doudnabacteria bacterium]